MITILNKKKKIESKWMTKKGQKKINKQTI